MAVPEEHRDKHGRLEVTPTQWLKEEIFHRYLDSSDGVKTAVRALQVVGGAVVSVIIAKKLLQMLGENDK